MLRSPFHTPPSVSAARFRGLEPLFNTGSGSNIIQLRANHVSLSQIELFPASDLYRFNHELVDLSFTLPPAMLPLGNSVPSREGSQSGELLSLEVDEHGHAFVQVVSSPRKPCSTGFSQQTAASSTGHWGLSSDVLELSSSPSRHLQSIDSFETSSQHAEIPVNTQNETLVEPPSSPCFPLAAGDPLPHLEPVPLTKPAVSVVHLETSDIDSDVNVEITDPGECKIIELRSQDQIRKVLRRGVKRAQREIDEDSQDAETDSQPEPELEPCERPKNAVTIHGEPTRVKALRKVLAKSTLRPLRGTLKCKDHCNKTFTSFVGLAQHFDEFHDLSARCFECPVLNCPWAVIGFAHSNECKRHIQSAHNNRRYVCELCEIGSKHKRFARTDALRRHLEQIHGCNTAKRRRTAKQ